MKEFCFYADPLNFAVSTFKLLAIPSYTVEKKKLVNKKRLGSLNNGTFIVSCYINGKNKLMW